MLKKLVLLNILMLITSNSWPSELNAGDTVYVWAKNGLWLREGPGITAKSIEELPYGTPLKILDKGQGAYESTVLYIDKKSEINKEGIRKYNIAGAWREVQNINKESQKGYIFDGWLLNLPPVECDKETDSLPPCIVKNWGVKYFGLLKKTHTNKVADCETCGTTRYRFGKGFSYTTYEPGYGSDEELILPNLNLPQGVVAALGFFGWWEEDKPSSIKVSDKEVEFIGTYQHLSITLIKDKKRVKINNSCRDC